MNRKLGRVIFVYMILSFGVSLILAVFITLLLLQMAYLFKDMPLFSNIIESFRESVLYSFGIVPYVFLSIFVLMLVCFLIFNFIILARLNQISAVIGKLANGHFDIEIKQSRVLKASGIIDDLNEMKEQLSLRIEEEKRAVQSKNELVTNVSHDLRTPLTSIIGYLGLIQNDQYKDEVELRYYVDIAYEKSIRLNRMVNDLFEFTKVNNKDVMINYQSFNLIELLKQLSAQFFLELKQANMEIFIHHEDEGVNIDADPDKLMRVFENLISNAIKYGSNGNKIDIIVVKKEEQVVVHVKNYGEKIPSNVLPHIFDRLYRGEKSRSDQTGGAGLGLAIAKGIVELHHGKISVISNEMETDFQVELPMTT
ncbi:sensor histidine kinase [Chengkuizengella marina]|uniref:histidine kinase n=1 Tax=Chengkuizengella marina TaxID=2507566 RepID=A0A6N9Q5L8_9BACL|nr:ATP-binding protein [Chengkuizengella marina]NBI30117.1 GHKL domain-containing protein [Chengkuizengella marina]